MAIEQGDQPTKGSLKGSDLWVGGRNSAPGEPKPAMTDAERLLLPDTEVGVTVPDDVSSLTNIEGNPTTPAEASPITEADTVENQPKRNRFTKIIATVASLAVAAAGFGVIKAVANSNHQPTASQTVATAPANPTPEQTADPVTPEAFTYTSEVLKQTISVESMLKMTDKQFAQLLCGDRAAFMIETSPSTAKVALSSEADELDALNNPAAIPMLYWNQQKSVGYSMPDQNTGAKIGSLSYYSTNKDGSVDASYQEITNDILANGGAGVGNSTSYVFDSAGQLQSGLDRDGKSIDWIDITTHTESNGVKGPTITSQAIRVSVELLDGSKHTVYLVGYTTAGKASPVAGYPY